ncbi:hypothetical protein [Acinetobacter ursingii]|uniref:hypothetical protein n=1 Tax=Acinetobacter ursingii TaxID=108980 RepID=UPI003AF5DC3A
MSEDLNLVKISNLPDTTHITANDVIPVVQNGVTKKVPSTGIRKYVTDTLGTAAFASTTDFEPSGSMLEVDLKAQARADEQNKRIDRIEVAAYLLKNNKVFKAYRNKALMLADVVNIPANSLVQVVNDPANDVETNDINGQYHYDGSDFLKLPDDILSLIDVRASKISTQAKEEAILAAEITSAENIKIVKASISDSVDNFSMTIAKMNFVSEQREAQYQTQWSGNKFNAWIFPTILKNQTVNYLSTLSWFLSDFDTLRLRIIDISNLNWQDAMSLSDFLQGKKVYRDVTYKAEDVCHGSPRIEYAAINNGINIEIRLDFEPISSFGDNELKIGFLIEAFKGTSKGIIHNVSSQQADQTITNQVGMSYYTENGDDKLRRIGSPNSASFAIGYQQLDYKQNIRSLLNTENKLIDSITNVTTSFSYDKGGYLGFGKVFNSLKNIKFNCVSFFLNGLSTLDGLRYVIYSVPDDQNMNNGWIGYKSGHPVYMDFISTSAYSDDNGYYEIEFPFDDSLINDSQLVGIMVQGIKNDLVVPIGFQCAFNVNSLEAAERGCYAGIRSDGTLSFDYLSNDLMFCFKAKFYNGFLALKQPDVEEDAEVELSHDYIQSAFMNNLEIKGLKVTFDLQVANAANVSRSMNSSVILTSTQTKSETRTITLLKSEDVSWENRNEYLARYMHDVIVKKGNVTLTEDKDYKNFSWYGKLNAILDSLNNASVSVSYAYEPFRVDVIGLNTESKTIVVLAGAERSYDPYEYIAEIPENIKPLALALVQGNTCEVFSLGDVYEIAGLPIQPTGDWNMIMQHNQRCLSTTLAKLNRKENIKLIGFGDSITACEWVGAKGLWEVPNGMERDRLNYLSRFYPADTLSKISVFSRNDDSNGVITDHAEIGWNWYLKNYIEKKFGVTVNYENWAIGGGAVWDGKNRMQFVLPTVANGDLAVICYGTNGGINYSDLKAIIDGFQSKGVSIIFMPIPRANPSNNHNASHDDIWSSINGVIAQSALKNSCAVVPTWHYIPRSASMSIGLSDKFHSNQNLINHPGIYEFKCYGRMLINAFNS